MSKADISTSDLPKIEGALVTLDGKIRFTAEEKKRLRRYFSASGIDVGQIRTVADYHRARNAAAPGFMDWLAAEIERKPLTPERQQLIEILRAPTGPSKDR